MNRIDRISAILIHLQSRKVVKAQDIADRFGISLRTVYRDVRTLEQAGIPLIGEAGMGYSLVEGYRLPPVMFSREEALAFLTAEKLVSQLTDGPNALNYSSAMFKIKAVLDEDKKDLLQNIGDHIEVVNRPGSEEGKPDISIMQPILKSIDLKKVLELKYHARYNQQRTEREVEPLGVFYAESVWHLIAFCRMRNDYRDFRFDRISAISVGNLPFSKTHPTLQEYLTNRENHWQDDPVMCMVVIRLSKSISYWLENQKYYQGFVSETDLGDEVEMTFISVSLKGFARWFMMFGDKATIIKPEQLKTEVKMLVDAVSEKVW